MATNNLTIDNHYVSQEYLKQWEASTGEICVYRILVSHESVPLWAQKSVKGIAYQQHLYTRQIAGTDSDDIEKWFSEEFETPAKIAINKVINEERLSPEDWQILVRFLALHDVRTPARFIEYMERAPTYTQEILEEIAENLQAKVEKMQCNTTETPKGNEPFEKFPFMTSKEIKEGEEYGTLYIQTYIGRASWLTTLKHLLSDTINALHQHKWTIMHPAEGMTWFTTDKPVIKLNHFEPENYNFDGGWGSKGTEILFPLSPKHLLYTRIGYRRPNRGTSFSIEQTKLIRRVMAEHAHRFIYSKSKEEDISSYAPRKVDLECYKCERKQWDLWHNDQSNAENEYFNSV